MVIYTGIIRVITKTDDVVRDTIGCESFAEACIAIGNLTSMYIRELILETGVEKTEIREGKRMTEYIAINKMNKETEMCAREWVKRDPNYAQIRDTIHIQWRKLNDLRDKCDEYLFSGKV